MNIITLIATSVGFGPVIGAFVLGLILGVILSFVLYSPEKRAAAKLEQLLHNEERALAGYAQRYSSEFRTGVSHLLGRLKGTVTEIKNRL